MENKVLATVAGQEITERELDAFVSGLPREQQMYASNPQFREQCLEQLVALHLLAKEGEELKLDETEEFLAIIANARKDILAQMAMRNVLSGLAVSEDEMKKFYEENSSRFMKGESVSAKHILVDSEEKCAQILEEIQGGKAFEEAAQAYSTCPSGQKGGDLGSFGKGQMVKEFETAAFEAEIGQVVGPVQTQFGYHLIKVEAKSEATTMAFDEVKENIRKSILQEKQNNAYNEKIGELKSKWM